MSRSSLKTGWLFFVAICAVIGMAAGCDTEDQPPLDELPLRDALQADPSVIYELPPDALHGLAQRLQDAYRDQTLTTDAAHPNTGPRYLHPGAHDELSDVTNAVLAFDAARADQDEDALVSLSADLAAQELRLSPFRPRAARGARTSPSVLPFLEGADPRSPTYAVEARALAGEAGALLAELLAARGATRLVRVTQWPAGIVAVDDVIYVNAVWLVAMVALDNHGVDEGIMVGPSGAGIGSGRTAKAIPTNVAPPPGLPPPAFASGPLRCSIAGTDASRDRRAFWIVGPLLFVIFWGHTRSWKTRSPRG